MSDTPDRVVWGGGVARALGLALGLAVGVAVVAEGPAVAKPEGPGAGRLARGAEPRGPLVGLSLLDAAGAPYRDSSVSASSRVTLVGIWASWCPSCREELPSLIQLSRELDPTQVRLLLISVDRNPARGVRHLESIGYKGEAAFDPGAGSVRNLGIQGIPTVLVLDNSGRERDRITGGGREAETRLRASALKVLGGTGRIQTETAQQGASNVN